jgi:predicted nuclease of restriction endonuclease-like (RecB) superfamily
VHGEATAGIFKDAYVVEFLNLPDEHSEADLHRGLLAWLKAFLIELGRDFCFVGSEYPVQVGGRNFAILAIEKVGQGLLDETVGESRP